MKKSWAKYLALVLLAALALSALSACNEGDVTTGGKGGFSKDDLYIEMGGSKYYCDVDIDDIIAVFGEDYESSEAISCAYDGMDKTFTYDRFEVFTYPDGDSDFVLELCVFDGDAKTSKGIKLGDSKQSVIDAYGEGKDTGYLLSYELAAPNESTMGASLYFKIENDTVIEMAITAEQPIQ